MYNIHIYLVRVNKYFKIDRNFTEVEKMLLLIRKYGFTHVCANREFEIKKDPTLKNQATELIVSERSQFWPFLNYPQLDFRIQKSGRRPNVKVDIDFYFRGAKDQEREAEFQNLFEYLLSRSFAGTGLLNFYIYI